MKSSNFRFLVGVILIECLSLPLGLAAQERRGADLVVTKLDGSGPFLGPRIGFRI